MSDMNDRVALITGASSGIGRATGEAFAGRGAKVVLALLRNGGQEEKDAARISLIQNSSIMAFAKEKRRHAVP
jgi:NAD(P)-dependent dehydrogenase (short-subunit alcohol dehydrogenase family)